LFAINHAATALIIKRAFPGVPIPWILLSVQLVEFIWVFFNLIGFERTRTKSHVTYVGDISLEQMPYSHSVVSMVGMATLSWFIIDKGFNSSQLALAFSLGVLSHLLLDLITHAKDIQLAPMIEKPRLGLGLYANWPMQAFFLEIGYGLLCWWIYKGGWPLLLVIVVFNLANISMFSRAISGLEKKMANRPRLIAGVIFIQIVVTLFLVGLFS
jgi:membrane-bound metal-dependent hydrolase YbcI (DUF457 family)